MTPRRARAIALLLVAVSVAAVVVALRTPPRRALDAVAGPSALLQPASDSQPAPELDGITGWLNAPPMSLTSLRGRVVIVDFWTYTCINCRRSMPFLRRLHDTYAARGLTVIGVHSPEFDFEKIPDNVSRAVAELDVTWPVAEDPNKATWEAYDNQYWPAKHIVDAAGRRRGVHIGEGDESSVEEAVRALLVEAGRDPGPSPRGSAETQERPPARGDDVTPELYLGAQRGGPAYGDAGPPDPGRTEVRRDPMRGRDVVRLRGPWRGAVDYVTGSLDARLDVDVRARDVYLLAAPERGAAPGEVEVLLGGAPVPAAARGRSLRATPDGRTVLVVVDDDLQHVLTAGAVSDRALSFVIRRPGTRLFTFAFGG